MSNQADAYTQARADVQLGAALAAVPSCSLDEEGVARQRERQARLAPGVTGAVRDGDVMRIDFAAGFDRRALDELVAQERQCCPFFRFDFDEDRRRLEVRVDDPDHRPALEALAAACGAGEQPLR